jgi:hypothetical protein
MPLRPIQAEGAVQMAEEEDLTVIYLLRRRVTLHDQVPRGAAAI